MNDKDWEEAIISMMVKAGWTKDIDDEITLGFYFIDSNDQRWIRDYNKKNRRFVHFNGSLKVNIRVTPFYQENINTYES